MELEFIRGGILGDKLVQVSWSFLQVHIRTLPLVKELAMPINAILISFPSPLATHCKPNI